MLADSRIMHVVAIPKVFLVWVILVDASLSFLASLHISPHEQLRSQRRTPCHGWLDQFFVNEIDSEKAEAERKQQYPEQYSATYEMLEDAVKRDRGCEAAIVRPLLKQTQLEGRPIELAYDANRHGWSAAAFHRAVDGKGAAVVLAETSAKPQMVGGYNPKGWASLGGARPSVAAFVFYSTNDCSSQSDAVTFQKLRKVGGGGLACASDDPGFGISFGPDALVISLQQGRERLAQSKLGPYYERGPNNLPSLFPDGSSKLVNVKVFVGIYDSGEEVPYSGGVLDMTSG